MDLKTKYLGLELKHPIIVGASPLTGDLDRVKQAEDAGAAAIVMHSLFEEQLLAEAATQEAVEANDDSFVEARSYLPKPEYFVLGPEEYLEQIRKVKAAVGCPVIGSLNGVTNGGWLRYAKMIEGAGADALELNLYSVAHDPKQSALDVEHRLIETVKVVARETKLPLAVKLSPFFSSLANLARELRLAGAKGLVLFNRFYQPDIDVDALDVDLKLQLSTPSELRLRLRWLALLSGRLEGMSLSASGGVHSGLDVLKAVMAGADSVQVVSTVLQHGPQRIGQLVREVTEVLEKKEYESLAQAKGSMNLSRSPSPEQYERGNYVRMLQGYVRSYL